MSSAEQQRTDGSKPGKDKIKIKINDEHVTVLGSEHTPRELLQLVGETPDDHYLVLLKGKREQESYKDSPDVPIAVEPGMKFITLRTGGSTVS